MHRAWALRVFEWPREKRIERRADFRHLRGVPKRLRAHAPKASVGRRLAWVAVLTATASCSGMSDDPPSANDPSSGASYGGATPTVGQGDAGTPPGDTPSGTLVLATLGAWARGSVHPVRWDPPRDLPSANESVVLETSRDGGASYARVGTAITGEGYARFTAPEDGPSTLRVRVTFRTIDGRGNEIPLRRLVSNDITLTPSAKRAYAWQKTTSAAPFGPRDGAGGIVHAGKMWLVGGWNGERFPLQTANDVWSSTDGAAWTRERDNTYLSRPTFDYTNDWEGRHFAGYLSFGGSMWIVGGDPNQGHYQTDVWKSTDGRTWTRTDAFAPRQPYSTLDTDPDSPTFGTLVWNPRARASEESQFGMRALHVVGVLGDRMLVLGGQRIAQYVNPDWPGRPAKILDDVWSSRDGVTFSEAAKVGPRWAPRGLVSEAVEHDGRLWLVGGGALDDPGAGATKREYRNDVWSTRDGAAWERSPGEAPFSPRIWHNVKVFDGRLWVLCGYDGSEPGAGRMADNLADAWYSADGTNWYEASPPAGFVPRHAATAWAHAGSLFVGSGNAIGPDPAAPSGPGVWYADVWKLSPAP